MYKISVVDNLVEPKLYNSFGDIVSQINFAGKNVGFMTGCYCPPHKGHYDTWANACDDLHLDILCLRSTNRGIITKSRHGMPYEFTRDTIVEWGKELFRAYNTILMISYEDSSSENPYYWDIPDTLNHLYNI